MLPSNIEVNPKKDGREHYKAIILRSEIVIAMSKERKMRNKNINE